MSDELLESACEGDVEVLQVNKKGGFEKLDPDTGLWHGLEEWEE